MDFYGKKFFEREHFHHHVKPENGTGKEENEQN